MRPSARLTPARAAVSGVFMKVLLAAPELSPWMRAGVMGDTAAGLAGLWRGTNPAVVVALPDYPIFSCLRGLERRRRLPLKFSFGGLARHAVWTEARMDGRHLLLLEKPEFFDRAAVYGLEKKGAYDDNLTRFVFWAQAVRALARERAFDVVHALDWPGALVAALHEEGDPPVVLGLGDLDFPGDFPAEQFPATGLPWEEFARFEFYGRMNCVKAGLQAASAVVFPSARRAALVGTAQGGGGLEGVAAAVADRTQGLLAGVDYEGWFDAREPAARRQRPARRAEWLDEAGLRPLAPDGLFLVVPLALAAGRGLDLLMPVLDRLMEFPVRVVVLGRPDPFWAPSLELATWRHRGAFLLHDEPGEATWRAIAAAADMVLVADALEPDDDRLPAMMRSGAVPMAQFCPGLHEIVQDDDPAGRPGTGLVFYRHHPEALWDAFRRALVLRQGARWDDLVARSAATDFSWAGAGLRYRVLWSHIITHHAA